MTEVTHPTLDLCLKEASALTATHLKGLKSQCRDRLSMEQPSTQSASSFFTPAIKYTMKICKHKMQNKLLKQNKPQMNLTFCSQNYSKFSSQFGVQRRLVPFLWSLISDILSSNKNPLTSHQGQAQYQAPRKVIKHRHYSLTRILTWQGGTKLYSSPDKVRELRDQGIGNNRKASLAFQQKERRRRSRELAIKEHLPHLNSCTWPRSTAQFQRGTWAFRFRAFSRPSTDLHQVR